MAEVTKLGKYEVRRELGRGAMGVVYEAYDPLIERVVALKTIRADQLAGEHAGTIIARFRREAQAAGRLTHPNIVGIYDFGDDGGVWYIAMELVKGRELKEYFEANERFTPNDIVRILTQILAALGYSHKLGVIHRDIKPSNVFLLPDGTAKVADFGIAHVESSELTQVGTVLGTPAYMSPEQILGLPVDGRSDLFSVGVMLYQFLTGERPFTGSATITMRKVLEEDPLPPSRFNVQMPGAMDSVVKRALEKRPEDRFQTADEFANALRDALQAGAEHTGDTTMMPPPIPPAGGTGSASAARGEPGKATGFAPAPAPASAAKVGPPAKSQTAAKAVMLAGAAVAIGVALWLTLHKRGPDAPVVAATAATAPASAVVAPPVTGTIAAAPPTASPPIAPASTAPSAVAPDAAAASAVQAPVKADPGALAISAVGWIDPSDARYVTDRALLQSDLRADARGQLVEKALALLLDNRSLMQNYDVLRDRVLSQSGTFVTTVVRESEPHTGKDGLMSLTTEAIVNVKAVQKSLNQMSRDERIQFIRASGDPKVSVRITTRDEAQAAAPPQLSPIAENILKERIKSFGFRTWAEDAGRTEEAAKGADFAVEGEVRIRKLSTRLQASGLVINKYALSSWTIKCIDRSTGEEIYYNTALPAGLGSWASEEEALKAIGGKVAAEFSRDFFLQHVHATGRKVMLRVEAFPEGTPNATLLRELTGLPAVVSAAMRSAANPRVFELQLAGAGPVADVVAASVLKPLNAKLGQACFTVGATAGEEVAVNFDARCAEPSILSRLETNPPAALYGAPAGRQKAVIKNPETLRKLMV